MATEKRLRVSFDADDQVVRRAIYIAAAMSNQTHNEIMNALVREHLSEYMALAKKAIEREDGPPRRKTRDDS